MARPAEPTSSQFRPAGWECSERRPRFFRQPGTRLVLASTALLAVGLVGLLAMQAAPHHDLDRLLQEAQDQFRAGHPDRADALLDQLQDQRVPTPLDRLLRAQIAMADQRYPRARDELALIPNEHPIAPIARLLQGQSEVKLDHIPAAETAFLEATWARTRLRPGTPRVDVHLQHPASTEGT